jgi:hypothetical protein
MPWRAARVITSVISLPAVALAKAGHRSSAKDTRFPFGELLVVGGLTKKVLCSDASNRR